MYYKKLRILSYDNPSNVEEEYKNRFNSPTTLRTGLKIYPFVNGSRKTSESFELFYLPLQDILILEEQIKYNSENITRLRNKIPDIAESKIVLSAIIEEIQSTNEVEGVRSTRHEIGEAIINREEDGKKAKRFQGIVNMYMNLGEQSFEFIDNPQKIRDIYNKLFYKEISKDDWPDGNIFRKDPVEIKGNTKTIHTGNPDEETILRDVNSLIDFMNNKNVPFLTKCFVTHYFLEYIHPFYDGNGRLGRFIISSYLSRKLDLFTGFSFSNAVNNNRKNYYQAFEEVSQLRNYGEITFFVKAMLSLVISGQEKMIEKLEESFAKLNFINQYIRNINDISSDEQDILFKFIQIEIFGNDKSEVIDNKFASLIKVSRYKINKILKALEDKNYLVKTKSNPSCHKLSDKVLETIN